MVNQSQRRRTLRQTVALLIAAAALAGLAGPLVFDEQPAPPFIPPAKAYYRPDGGQHLSSDGHLALNTLSHLNMGRKIDLATASGYYLKALPSLGEKSAAKAVASGCLTARQRANLNGLIIEKCNPTKP